MLPAPVFSKRTRGSLSGRFAALRQRSRITNLGVLILVAFSALSFLFNLGTWISGYATSPDIVEPPPHSASHRLNSILSTIPVHVRAKNLIVVAGHAIWKGCLPEQRLDDKDWILEEYQKGTRSITAFFSHIVRGTEAVLADDQSLLVFSGGHTRTTSVISEGESYSRLAIESNLYHNGFLPFDRATSEEYALDSLQNMLFSIARFHEVTGTYPQHITVIGFEMKRKRFEELHIKALRWPLARFTYIGVDEEGDTTAQYNGEHTNGYLPFSRDLYGCHSGLQEKRRNRNWSFRFHPYHTSATELEGLLGWCPDEHDGGVNTIYPGGLPWDDL